MTNAVQSIADFSSGSIRTAPLNRILQAAEDTALSRSSVAAREGNVTRLPLLLTRQESQAAPAGSAAKEESFTWNAERIDRLKELAGDGKKAREIADILGTTKNSVICKCNRLGIQLKHKKPYMDNLKGIAKRTKNGKPLSEEEIAARTARLQQRIQNAGEPRERRTSTPRAPRSRIPSELLTFRPKTRYATVIPVISNEVDLSWIELTYATVSADPTTVRDLVEAHSMSAEEAARILRITPESVREICAAHQISLPTPVEVQPSVRTPATKPTKSARKSDPASATAKKGRATAVAAQEELPPYPGSLNISFMDLKERHCRQIMGSGGQLAIFCGHPKKEGSSFCVHHHRMNYIPFSRPNEAAKRPYARPALHASAV